MIPNLRSGGLVQLQARPKELLAWSVPLWTALCGAIASGRLTLSLDAGIKLLLVLLLVEVGWGSVWGALATTDWAALLRSWRNWRLQDDVPRLPYTSPDSPGERMGRWLAQVRSWTRTLLLPSAGQALGTAAAGAALSLLVAAVLGKEHLLLTAAAGAIMQIALLVDRGRGQAGAGWDSVLRVGLPWLGGHVAFATPLLPSLALAIAFSITFAATGSARQGLERTLWPAGQILAIALFILLQKALVAPFLFLLLIPQLLLATCKASAMKWPRQAWPWLAAGMLLAAWVV